MLTNICTGRGIKSYSAGEHRVFNTMISHYCVLVGQDDANDENGGYYYGLLLMLERDEMEKSKQYFKQSAEEGFVLAYAEYASILYLDKIDVVGSSR